MNSRTEGYIYLLGFALSIPLANWMIGNVGAVCPPDSPCLIPVAPGVMAPSGVLMIGLALVLRDLVQRRLGLRWVTGAMSATGGRGGPVSGPCRLQHQLICP